MKLTEEQIKQMTDLLDDWMPPNEGVEGSPPDAIMTTMWLNDITMIRIVMNQHTDKHSGYYLYRCFWMVDHPEVSLDVDDLDAEALLLKLLTILVSLGEMRHV